MEKYFPPEYEKSSFHCPYCKVYANQDWRETYFADHGYQQKLPIKLSICSHCKNKSYWYQEKLVIPSVTMAPLPHTDMPESIIDDYKEAANILQNSPRGSAALLRLALQKLMVELDQPGKDINKDIGALVKNGLPPMVQQALDIVRVIGNESVHPGQMDLKDDIETAISLFELINFIVEDRISRPKQISELYYKLPEGKRSGIEQRDKAPN